MYKLFCIYLLSGSYVGMNLSSYYNVLFSSSWFMSIKGSRSSPFYKRNALFIYERRHRWEITAKWFLNSSRFPVCGKVFFCLRKDKVQISENSACLNQLGQLLSWQVHSHTDNPATILRKHGLHSILHILQCCSYIWNGCFCCVWMSSSMYIPP